MLAEVGALLDGKKGVREIRELVDFRAERGLPAPRSHFLRIANSNGCAAGIEAS
jgi:hypothetical protein